MSMRIVPQETAAFLFEDRKVIFELLAVGLSMWTEWQRKLRVRSRDRVNHGSC